MTPARVLPCALVLCACAGSPTPPPPVVVAVPAASAAATPASSAPAPASSSPSAGVAPPGCSEKCGGLGTPELVAAATARAGQARPCYERALAADRALHGRMQVLVRLQGDGSVCETRLVSSDMPADMNRCVTQVLGGAGYPAPSGGCLDITVPLTFEPRDTNGP